MAGGAEPGSPRDLLPPRPDSPLASDLATACAQAAVRVALASAAGSLGFTVVLWFDPSWGAGFTDRLLAALRFGLPLGFSFLLTPFAELWVAEGRRRLSGAGLAYVCGLVGVWVAVFQAVYATRLAQSASPTQALHDTLQAADQAALRAGSLLLLLPLTLVAAWALRLELHKQPGAGRWVGLALYTLGGAAFVWVVPIPVWMPIFLFAVLPVMAVIDYWGADRVLARLRGDRADEPDPTPERAPLPPLPWSTRLILGGPGFLPGSVAWALVAGLLYWVTGGWELPAVAGLGWFLHVFLGANYANLLNRRRRHAQAELVARHRLADPLAKTPAQRRNDTLHLIWALCGQGRVREARGHVPQALTADTAPGFVEQTRRYLLAQAFSQGGDGATCLQLLDTVPTWRGRMHPIQLSQRAVALDQLDRPDEAQAVTQEIDTRLLGAQGEAIKHNNLAAFELHKAEADEERALGWAQVASASRWGQLPALRGTLGAALVATGEPEAALPHLEAAAAALAEAGSPQSRAWTQLNLGDALRALGREDEARAAYAVAAEVPVDCAPRLIAAARLED